LDPTLDYPWREWQELLTYADKESTLTSDVGGLAAAEKARDQIGYRRRDVSVWSLPGEWWITVPGTFAEEWEDDKTWLAYDATRTVRLSSISISSPDGPAPADGLVADSTGQEEGEVITQREGRTVGRASIKKKVEVGKNSWILHGKCAVAGSLAICTIYFEQASEREWAIRTWRSLGHH